VVLLKEDSFDIDGGGYLIEFLPYRKALTIFSRSETRSAAAEPSGCC